ncbi:MAG: hypothetical protein NPINA01_07530 [Nitrospinaceae bacterium]|nr:MAG: hypothetical protein NPINA01_07530 [Nitrospinaceae bacterium]
MLYIILKIVINFMGGDEMKKQSISRDIKVCSGAGCKAWSSERIARELEGLEMEGYRVCRVACMKKCGGGATVQALSSGELLKMRDPDEAIDVLIREIPSLLPPVFS